MTIRNPCLIDAFKGWKDEGTDVLKGKKDRLLAILWCGLFSIAAMLFYLQLNSTWSWLIVGPLLVLISVHTNESSSQLNRCRKALSDSGTAQLQTDAGSCPWLSGRGLAFAAFLIHARWETGKVMCHNGQSSSHNKAFCTAALWVGWPQ